MRNAANHYKRLLRCLPPLDGEQTETTKKHGMESAFVFEGAYKA